jgi:hypothetical protein
MSTGIDVKYEPKLNRFISCWHLDPPRKEELPRQVLRTPRLAGRTAYEDSAGAFGDYAAARADNG